MHSGRIKPVFVRANQKFPDVLLTQVQNHRKSGGDSHEDDRDQVRPPSVVLKNWIGLGLQRCDPSNSRGRSSAAEPKGFPELGWVAGMQILRTEYGEAHRQHKFGAESK